MTEIQFAFTAIEIRHRKLYHSKLCLLPYNLYCTDDDDDRHYFVAEVAVY